MIWRIENDEIESDEWMTLEREENWNWIDGVGGELRDRQIRIN
jgi:hypothetical protein